MYINTNLSEDLEQSLLTTWDAKIVEYDNDRFPFNEWILNRIRLMGYPLEDLTDIHKVVDDKEVYNVSKRLCADTNLPEFRRMVNRFVREVVVPKGKLGLPVAVQRFLNVRIMLPDKPESIFPFHTGLLYGHGAASRSLWMPLTDVSADEDYTASMQIIDIVKSRELIQYAVDKQLSIAEMTKVFGAQSWTLKAGPGKVVFFNQENIHGNFVNVTGKTRVSIDFRVADAKFGDQLARKIVGGYFAIIAGSEEEEEAAAEAAAARPDTADAIFNGKRYVMYLNNSTRSTYGIPVHLQRYMTNDYCQKKKITCEFELFELEDMLHLPTLHHILDYLKCNVVLYSIFSLPENKEFRARILDAIVRNGIVMHFVNEDMTIASEADRKDVERIFEFAQYGRRAIGLPEQSAVAAE